MIEAYPGYRLNMAAGYGSALLATMAIGFLTPITLFRNDLLRNEPPKLRTEIRVRFPDEDERKTMVRMDVSPMTQAEAITEPPPTMMPVPSIQRSQETRQPAMAASDNARASELSPPPVQEQSFDPRALAAAVRNSRMTATEADDLSPRTASSRTGLPRSSQVSEPTVRDDDPMRPTSSNAPEARASRTVALPSALGSALAPDPNRIADRPTGSSAQSAAVRRALNARARSLEQMGDRFPDEMKGAWITLRVTVGVNGAVTSVSWRPALPNSVGAEVERTVRGWRFDQLDEPIEHTMRFLVG